MTNKWPVLSYEQGKASYDTLHMWTQIVGKIKLALMPSQNHSWHVTLIITPSGLSTQTIPYENRNFQIDFNFLQHKLLISTSKDEHREFSLLNISVAGFYKLLFDNMAALDINVKIKPVPVELPNPIPFQEDTLHATYDIVQVKAFHEAMLCVQDVLLQYRSPFKGKASPIQFFWGSFDLAYSRFCGRRAPKHPGGIPHMPDSVAEEAYSHEVNSCGFWPGNDMLPEAAFYAYIYPEPAGFKNTKAQPEAAYYDKNLGEFILPYSAVQAANEPEKTLLSFFNSTYINCSGLAEWNRDLLE